MTPIITHIQESQVNQNITKNNMCEFRISNTENMGYESVKEFLDTNNRFRSPLTIFLNTTIYNTLFIL